MLWIEGDDTKKLLMTFIKHHKGSVVRKQTIHTFKDAYLSLRGKNYIMYGICLEIYQEKEGKGREEKRKREMEI